MTNILRKVIPPVLLIVSTVVSIIAFTLGYNAETGYLVKPFATVILYAAIGAGIILAIWCALSAHKESTISFNTKIYLPTLLAVHIVAASCAPIASISGAKFVIGGTAVTFIKAIFVICCYVAFITTPAMQYLKRDVKIISPINHAATVVFCLSAIILFYFDHSVEMNNPQKLLLQLALAAICLSSLAALRLLIYGNGTRLFIFAKLCSVTLAPAATVAAIFARNSGEKFFSSFYFFTAIIIGAYAVSDAVTLLFSKYNVPDKIEE